MVKRFGWCPHPLTSRWYTPTHDHYILLVRQGQLDLCVLVLTLLKEPILRDGHFLEQEVESITDHSASRELLL